MHLTTFILKGRELDGVSPALHLLAIDLMALLEMCLSKWWARTSCLGEKEWVSFLLSFPNSIRAHPTAAKAAF